MCKHMFCSGWCWITLKPALMAVLTASVASESLAFEEPHPSRGIARPEFSVTCRFSITEPCSGTPMISAILTRPSRHVHAVHALNRQWTREHCNGNEAKQEFPYPIWHLGTAVAYLFLRKTERSRHLDSPTDPQATRTRSRQASPVAPRANGLNVLMLLQRFQVL